MTSSLKHLVEPNSTKWSSESVFSFRKKNSLVLDLDETLIHTRLNKFHDSCIGVPILTFNKITMLYLLLRPGVREFLDTMKKHYTLYIYTASDKQYAEAILTKLGLFDYFEKVYSRGYCYFSEGDGFTKDLQLLNLPLKQLVFVDDAEKHTTQNTLNGLYIKPFTGDLQDKELLLLTPFLKEIATASDVRPVYANFDNYFKKKEGFSMAEINSPDSIFASELPRSKPKIFLKGIHQRQNSFAQSSKGPDTHTLRNNQSFENKVQSYKQDKQRMMTFQKKLIPLTISNKSRSYSVISIRKKTAPEESPTVDLAEVDEKVLQQNISIKKMTISCQSLIALSRARQKVYSLMTRFKKLSTVPVSNDVVLTTK